MRFRLIDGGEEGIPRPTSLQGFLASARAAILPGRIDRPAVDRIEDMVLLAHIRSAFALSNATYGSPRMTRELRDDGSPSVVTGSPG